MMATYILIICQNYIIPILGEYILKISSKLVDNIIVKVDRARSISQNKLENIFYSKRWKNIGKLRTSCPIKFLRRILKKKKKKKFAKNEKENKFCKAILPVLVLTASP